MARLTSWLRPGWQRVIVCASGPSFSSDQAQRIAEAQAFGAKVIVVNDNWERVPTADILFAADTTWWKHVRENPPQETYLGMRNCDAVRASGFKGELWTRAEIIAKAYGLDRWINCVNRPGLTKREQCINGGGNSGYMAVNLAYVLGAEQIVLVGFDMKRNAAGMTHWFGDHPGTMNKGTPYDTWLQKFRDLASDATREGIDIVNCSADTAMRSFRRSELEDVLNRWRKHEQAA